MGFIRWMPAAVFAQTVSSHHSPLEGEWQDEGASPKSRRWGEHRKRPLRPTAQENRKGRGAAYPPPQQPRLAAWLPRLPLKGGVMGK